MKHGVVCYICGYHPLFLVASCFFRLARKPFIVGSFAIAYGFIKCHITHTRQVNDPNLIHYLRAQQLRRLCGLKTVWK